MGFQEETGIYAAKDDDGLFEFGFGLGQVAALGLELGTWMPNSNIPIPTHFDKKYLV